MAKTATALEEFQALVEKQKEARAKLTENLAARHRELSDEIREIERALGWEEKRKAKATASGTGSDAGIRWGSKNNTWIAEQITKSDGGISMADLKAAAKKAKLSELSIYQAARTLLKKGGLVESGDLLAAGPGFPTKG